MDSGEGGRNLKGSGCGMDWEGREEIAGEDGNGSRGMEKDSRRK